MAARYEVRLYNSAGQQVALIDEWRSLELDHTLNSFSTHTITMRENDPRIPAFELDTLFVARRCDPNPDSRIDWYDEYVGLCRTPDKQYTETDTRIYTNYGRGLLDLINRKGIAYPAGSVQGDKSGAGDQVIADYVNENAGPGANDPTRFYDGTTPGLTVQPVPGGRGTIVWQGASARRRLLDVIKDIGIATAVDFDVVWLGGRSYDFRTYWPLRGVNRTYGNGVVSPVVFSTGFGNMVTPHYVYSRTEEYTVAMVAGQGQQEDRVTSVRVSPHATDSPWNAIELFVDARQQSDPAALDVIGDIQLAKLTNQENVSFKVVQTDRTRYGRDYFVGDLVTVRFEDITLNRKITGARITMTEGVEDIDITFGDIFSC